jgi:hypothetical protein
VAESENLPPAQIEEARKRTAEAFEEMRYRGRNLVICMLPSGARWSISWVRALRGSGMRSPEPNSASRRLMIKRPRAGRLALRHHAAVGGQPGGFFICGNAKRRGYSRGSFIGGQRHGQRDGEVVQWA